MQRVPVICQSVVSFQAYRGKICELPAILGTKHTAPQTGRPRVRLSMVSLEFFIDIILPAALWPWGWHSLRQKWIPGAFPGGKGGWWVGLTPLTTFMYWLSWNVGASTSWNPQRLSRPVMGLLYLEIAYMNQEVSDTICYHPCLLLCCSRYKCLSAFYIQHPSLINLHVRYFLWMEISSVQRIPSKQSCSGRLTRGIKGKERLKSLCTQNRVQCRESNYTAEIQLP
jgi:hypothetical protein